MKTTLYLSRFSMPGWAILLSLILLNSLQVFAHKRASNSYLRVCNDFFGKAPLTRAEIKMLEQARDPEKILGVQLSEMVELATSEKASILWGKASDLQARLAKLMTMSAEMKSGNIYPARMDPDRILMLGEKVETALNELLGRIEAYPGELPSLNLSSMLVPEEPRRLISKRKDARLVSRPQALLPQARSLALIPAQTHLQQIVSMDLTESLGGFGQNGDSDLAIARDLPNFQQALEALVDQGLKSPGVASYWSGYRKLWREQDLTSEKLMQKARDLSPSADTQVQFLINVLKAASVDGDTSLKAERQNDLLFANLVAEFDRRLLDYVLYQPEPTNPIQNRLKELNRFFADDGLAKHLLSASPAIEQDPGGFFETIMDIHKAFLSHKHGADSEEYFVGVLTLLIDLYTSLTWFERTIGAIEDPLFRIKSLVDAQKDWAAGVRERLVVEASTTSPEDAFRQTQRQSLIDVLDAILEPGLEIISPAEPETAVGPQIESETSREGIIQRAKEKIKAWTEKIQKAWWRWRHGDKYDIQ